MENRKCLVTTTQSSSGFREGLGKSKGAPLKTLRYALTGELHGPALAEIMGILESQKFKTPFNSVVATFFVSRIPPFITIL